MAVELVRLRTCVRRSAPEIYAPAREGYGLPVDLWSLGVVIWCLMGGRFPYKQTEPLALSREARTTLLKFTPEWDCISVEGE